MRRILSVSLLCVSVMAGYSASAQEQAPALVPPAASPSAATLPAPATADPVASAPALPGVASPAASWLEGPIPPEVGKLTMAASIPALRNLVQQGTEIRYLGDEYGLKAYLMTNNTQGQVVYLTPDGQGVLVGTLFSGDASAVTFMQLLRLRRTGFDPTPFFSGTGQSTISETGAATPAVNESPGERLLREANAASWIGFGQPEAPQIVTFMDPNCSHCHELFKKLAPYTAQNKLYVRVIPVSLVEPIKSRQDVFNILGANNPAAAWTSLLNGEMIAAVSKPEDKVILALDSNNKLFTDWQLKVTPYSVYRAVSGEVKIIAATPKDFDAFLKDLGVTP